MINTIGYKGHKETTKDGKKIAIPIPPRIVLQLKGPVLQIIITQPKLIAEKLKNKREKVPTIKVNALIDTGAFGSVITPKVVKELKLLQTGVQNVTSVQDKQARPVYFALLMFPWGSWKEVPVVSCPLEKFDCLIGRDILKHWNMIYNGNDGFITICD